MPSPRPSSPRVRPSSPLSPSYKAGTHIENFQPPSPRSMQARTPNSQRLPMAKSLKLPSLPRFHPANFPSGQNSAEGTPEDIMQPHYPISPRSHQRLYRDVQRQLYLNQREMLSPHDKGSSTGQNGKPTSPRLAPLGSPGPVTPLELEGEEGYLVAGARNSSNDKTPSRELVDRLIREEIRRQRTSSK